MTKTVDSLVTWYIHYISPCMHAFNIYRGNAMKHTDFFHKLNLHNSETASEPRYINNLGDKYTI